MDVAMEDLQLHTKRLILRRPVASDLEPYTRYCQSPRSGFVGGPYTSVQAFDKLAAMIGHWTLRGFGRFILTDRDTGRPLGHVGALQVVPDTTPEMTWTLWSGADEGRGYATEASRAYCGHAAAGLGFRVMIARIDSDNAASRRLAEHLGGVLNHTAAAPDWWPTSVTYDLALAVPDR